MSTLEEFAFQTPLYVKRELPKDMLLKSMLLGFSSSKVDGYCPNCGKSSTFSLNGIRNFGGIVPMAQRIVAWQAETGYFTVKLECAREKSHVLKYWVLLEPEAYTKVGQNPSLADIANDEASEYRGLLEKADAAELHKAIGLAAHGVGIGSFVYLRRVFERLIYGRFDEFKDAEGWTDEDFFKMKMDEKVRLLKDHIPEFLYDNRRIYAVLSKGIHELSEEACLRFFDPLKMSIQIILEEDKKKKEELALKEAAAAAIAEFEA